MRDQPDLESLLSLLHHLDPKVRSEAIHRLGEEGSRQAMQALRDVVRDDGNTHCRKSALYWLRKRADRPLYNEAIYYALEDEDPFLRMHAAWSIRQADRPNPGIVEPLLSALASSRDMPAAVPMMLSALGKLGDRRAFEPIAAYLKSESGYQRGVAAQALGRLGDTRAVGHLTQLLDDHATAWKEDHGPERTVADIARRALARLTS